MGLKVTQMYSGRYVQLTRCSTTPPLYASMCVGLIKNVPTCEELVREVESEAEAVIAELQNKVKVTKPSRNSKL